MERRRVCFGWISLLAPGEKSAGATAGLLRLRPDDYRDEGGIKPWRFIYLSQHYVRPDIMLTIKSSSSFLNLIIPCQLAARRFILEVFLARRCIGLYCVKYVRPDIFDATIF